MRRSFVIVVISIHSIKRCFRPLIGCWVSCSFGRSVGQSMDSIVVIFYWTLAIIINSLQLQRHQTWSFLSLFLSLSFVPFNVCFCVIKTSDWLSNSRVNIASSPSSSAAYYSVSVSNSESGLTTLASCNEWPEWFRLLINNSSICPSCHHHQWRSSRIGAGCVTCSPLCRASSL